MSIQLLALLLLVGHVGSVILISFVIRRQLALFKIPALLNLKHFRRTLFYLSLFILVGNFVPIVIDLLTLFIETGRPPHVRLVSIMYAGSNAMVQLASAYLIWKLYQLAADTKNVTDHTAAQLLKK